MLKKIPIDALRLGMHLDGLCGAWLDHPFWKTRFVIVDPAELARLQGSGVAECLIDTHKGRDVDAPAPAEASAEARPPAAAPQAAPVAACSTPLRASLEEEAARAAQICAQARHAIVSLFDAARMGRALDVTGCAPLVEAIAGSMQRNASVLLGMLRLKTHDDYTFMHSVAVSTLMVALSRQLGHSEAQVHEAGLAGLLHDLGKARIPLQVLNKPGKLSSDEYRLVKNHARHGHDMLLAAGVCSEVALDVCLHHHERPDGQGYPQRLNGTDLSLHARMAALCDVYDAITSNRPYKDAWGPADAIAKMAEWAKAGMFDASVFRAFVDCVGIYPVGSLVRLQSQRLAGVVEQNRHSLVAPRVKVFYSMRAQMAIPVETLDLGLDGCRERILGRESNARWRFPFLDALSRSPTAPGAARHPPRTACHA
jgi:putative nucleotidyltransferase with HDIG domain